MSPGRKDKCGRYFFLLHLLHHGCTRRSATRSIWTTPTKRWASLLRAPGVPLPGVCGTPSPFLLRWHQKTHKRFTPNLALLVTSSPHPVQWFCGFRARHDRYCAMSCGHGHRRSWPREPIDTPSCGVGGDARKGDQVRCVPIIVHCVNLVS